MATALVRSDVGGVARLRAELRVAAAERYRVAIAEQSRTFAAFMFVAAIYDRASSLARLVHRFRESRRAVFDVAIAHWRRHPGSLAVERAAVGNTDELSLSLSGEPDLCAAVRGVELVHRDGETVGLSAVVSASGGSVRIAATLPAERFTDEHPAWQIVVTDGARRLEIVTPTRSALVQRWADDTFAAQRWPARIVLDPERQLSVEGRLPAHRSIEHTVAVGLTSATITWAPPRDGRPELRCTSRHQETVLVPAGSAPGPAFAATLDLADFVADTDTVWDVSVGGAGGTWLPLRLLPGEFPALGLLPDPTQSYLRRPDGTAVRIRLGYTTRNQVCIRVGAAQ